MPHGWCAKIFLAGSLTLFNLSFTSCDPALLKWRPSSKYYRLPSDVFPLKTGARSSASCINLGLTYLVTVTFYIIWKLYYTLPVVFQSHLRCTWNFLTVSGSSNPCRLGQPTWWRSSFPNRLGSVPPTHLPLILAVYSSYQCPLLHLVLEVAVQHNHINYLTRKPQRQPQHQGAQYWRSLYKARDCCVMVRCLDQPFLWIWYFTTI